MAGNGIAATSSSNGFLASGWRKSSADLRAARVLVVGAGGIGCEAVKTLVLSGVRRLSILDMDTIDVTNLNRQFLFRREHVGLSKARVLAQAARRLIAASSGELGDVACTDPLKAEEADDLLSFDAFPPPGELPCGYCLNLFDSRISALSLKQFDIVFSCLDNVAARRHLNRLAASAETPLIEAGSAAENGQTTPIAAGVTTCFECSSNKPATPKKIPICTLRQRPENATHCVAWAKILYEGIWGEECRRPGGEESVGGSALNGLVVSSRARGLSDEALLAIAQEAMNLLFVKQILELLDLKKDWGLKPPPEPIALRSQTQTIKTDALSEDSAKTATTTLASQEPITPQMAEGLFLRSFVALTARQKRSAVQQDGGLSDEDAQFNERMAAFPFDKDDDLAVDFVAAAASLRMANFHIAPNSRWQLQSIAGKIVPAIAATNAIVAGLQVIQGMHLLKFMSAKNLLLAQREAQESEGKDAAQPPCKAALSGLIDESLCRQVWVKPFASGRRPEEFGKVLVAEKLEPVKSECFVCRQQRVTLRIADFKTMSIFNLFKQVFVEALGCHAPFVDAANNLVDPDAVEEDPGGRKRTFAFTANEEVQQLLLQHALRTESLEVIALCADYLELLKKQNLADVGLASGSLLTVTDFTQGSFQCEVLLLKDSSLLAKGETAEEAFALDFGGGAGELKNVPFLAASQSRDAETAQSGEEVCFPEEKSLKRAKTGGESDAKKAKTSAARETNTAFLEEEEFLRRPLCRTDCESSSDAQSGDDCIVECL